MSVRRLKTYAGSQGYVYQYYFVGKRTAPGGDEAGRDGTEYLFDVTSDRRVTYTVSVMMPGAAAREWAEAHGRALGDSEQYAAVKLRLFRAFDEILDMQAEGRALRVEAAFLEEALASLGVE